MRVSRTLLALSAFVLGLVVAQGASWLLNVGEPNAALAGERDAAMPALSLADHRQPLAPLAENATNADSLGAAQESSFTQPADEMRAAIGSGSPLGVQGETVAVPLDEMIAKLYEENPEMFLGLLVEKFVKDGEPLRALALLKENPKADGYMYSSVGNALREAGQLASAIDAYSESTRLDPMHSDSLQPLMELDPSAALMIMRQGLEWQPPPGNSGMRTRLAEAMLAAGQDEEAVKLIEELRAAGVKGDELTRLYGRVAPEAAEAELRSQIEAAEGNKKIGGLRRLAAMMEEAGRSEDARAVLDAILELNPRDTRARRMLMKSDTAAAVEFLAGRTVDEPQNSGLWADYGEVLFAEGRKIDAITAWEQSVSLNGDQRAVHKLLEHSPATVWSQLETFTANSGDDERWGDLGDLYWEKDRKDDAKRAWEKAWELDPSDGEWYGKLQAIQVGRNPFN